MFILMVVIFILGYTMIALEHPIKIDKAASALLMGAVLWALYALNAQDILDLGYSRAWHHFSELNPSLSKTAEGAREFIVHHDVMEHLADISTILFFLLGAMTIVEIVDQHEGFKIITDKIKTTKKSKLLWVLSILTFFMSAVLDNLTTTIVIIALLRKLVDDKQTRWFFAAMVVVAANAGGAFSPIGDVTTIMLWIGGQVTTANIIMKLFIPSLFTMIIPLLLLSFTLKGNVTRPKVVLAGEHDVSTTPTQQIVMLVMGVSALLFVPVFKTVTHLPPYLGMLFGLSIMWITTEIMHKKTRSKYEGNFKLSVNSILTKVDVPTIFFFLGILTAVAALESAGHLDLLATSLKDWGLGVYPVAIIIGLLSSIVDNVPLVAASMGMYPIDPFHIQYMQDGIFWELIAYTAGTGGSILIIGSAAGVAAMGMEKIDFIWYMKRISLLAALGFFAGAGTYYVQEMFMQESLEAKIITYDKIPQIAKDKMTADFSEYQVKETEKYIKGRKEVIGYVVEAEKDGEVFDIRFKEDGTFMEIVEDVESPHEIE